VTTLFTRVASEDKPEVINMNQLFNCKNVKWNGTEYEEIPEAEIEEDELLDYEDEDEDEDNVKQSTKIKQEDNEEEEA
jgi:hypothetical protein